MSHLLSCSFCRRSEHQVEKLVAGVGVYICDACVRRASEIIESAGSVDTRAVRPLLGWVRARFAGFRKPRGQRWRIAGHVA